jgi:hypothetical protein
LPFKKGPGGWLVTRIIIRSDNSNASTDVIELKDVYLSDMECDFTPYYSIGGKNIFPLWVEQERY